MASFLNSVRQGFGQRSNKGNNSATKSVNASPTIPSPTTFQPPSSSSISQGAPRVPPVAASPSLSSTMSGHDAYGNIASDQSMQPPPVVNIPLFMKDGMQIFIVKGNYMTLAAKPRSVETGEWLAHHVVEQFRLLSQFITVIQSSYRPSPSRTAIICNPTDCPTMSAGTHTYTWLDSKRVPTRLPACQYITLVQKWISGKILDPTLFPTDTAPPAFNSSSGMLNAASNTLPTTNLSNSLPTLTTPTWVGKSSGFPEHFLRDCKNIYKQMFRVWAHLYWAHFENPFYHLDLERHFNSSFVHFVVVGTEFDLLSTKDLEPMQPLLDKWRIGGVFPGDSRIVAQAAERERLHNQTLALQQMGGNPNTSGSLSAQGGLGPSGSSLHSSGLGDGMGSRQGSVAGQAQGSQAGGTA